MTDLVSTPLASRVTELVPRTLEEWDAATDDGRARMRERYARDDASYVRLNMITSLTGSAAGSDGTSETLTTRVDRAILQLIRRDADVVVVGAQSVRAEGYVIPSGARLAIVTSSGDLDGHRLTLSPGAAADQVLIVCPASRVATVTDRAQQPGVQVIGVAGSDRMTPQGILGALSELGHRRVVCEGGPSLASQFVAAGVIDEFCVTVAPVIEPAQHPFVTVTAQTRPDTDVDGLLVDGAGVSYLRLRVRA